MTVQMIAPAAGAPSVINSRTGNNYTPDARGLISAQPVDVPDLLMAGYLTIPIPIIGRLLGANMNITTDQPFTMFVNPLLKFRPTKITCTNASISLTTAAGGIYPAASKGGTAMVAAAQAYSALSAAALALDLTIVAGTLPTVYAAGVIPILSLTTGQGAAATADFYMEGQTFF